MSLDVTLIELKPTEVYWANITHNLNTMAKAADLYEALWRPEELGITKASQLIEPLSKGLSNLHKNKDLLEKFNPSNGWGDYYSLVNFVQNYLNACIDNPDSEVRVSR